MMFLEAQFGADITPLVTPRGFSPSNASEGRSEEDIKGDGDEREEEEVRKALELARLSTLGIPVPGLEIKVDKHVARVWLETLEVECANRTLRDRVAAVVERAVETVAPLWTGPSPVPASSLLDSSPLPISIEGKLAAGGLDSAVAQASSTAAAAAAAAAAAV